MQVLEEQLGRRGDAVAPLRPVLLRTLADVQQRLTFRVQAFIKARSLVYDVHSLSASRQQFYTTLSCCLCHSLPPDEAQKVCQSLHEDLVRWVRWNDIVSVTPCTVPG